MDWFDAHCHCDSADSEATWRLRARAAGVVCAASCAVNASSVRQQLADLTNPFWRRCLGVYPLEAVRLSQGELSEVLSVLRGCSGSFAALGEIGLDFSRATSVEAAVRQREVFGAFLDLSRVLEKPVVVHSRGAESECVSFLRARGVSRALLHWFSGSSDVLAQGVRAGFFFSVGPAVDRSKALQAVVRAAWPDRLLLETDAPVAFNGVSSDPSWIPRVGASVASLLGVSLEEVASRTTSNAWRFFELKT